MMPTKDFAVLALAAILSPGVAMAAQKAFPTAYGFGAAAVGGRGGIVYEVTNLNDHGSGSLRACVEAKGPRTCVFRVSGTIAVDTWIEVGKPYLTIAGQTSPGGIAIKLGASENTPLYIHTHDVILRHFRLRPGPSELPSNNVDTIQISHGAYNIIMDHMSTSWPTDEGINIVGEGSAGTPQTDARDMTIQWSILSEGLSRANHAGENDEPHSRGSYFGYGARNITFHHNLIADNMRRNPLVNTRDQFDYVNNVVYNSALLEGEFYTRFGDLYVNAIGNVGIVGPSSPRKSTSIFSITIAIIRRISASISRAISTYTVGAMRAMSAWYSIRMTGATYSAKPIGQLSLDPSKISGPIQAYSDIVKNVGANIPSRDAADRR